ncbi:MULTISPECIES: thioredoxin family protein [unclassified Nitratiruptor]|uniref:thioredoxin family protein n=1 Tax=unclassified Nitratiruptor TaxID=2624044 RepID=UPI001915A3A0|nr:MULTISPECIES: thioredoxin family protein [unclassified Nitratiruptor]BCD61106.1 hypothetical protein NitYY0810_C1887 [Nitratiruptor sp. YY08-10]BCD65039.1 hypothetical protein NitYY0814_C1896 [Nitratiruptor sp. YY08-14]
MFYIALFLLSLPLLATQGYEVYKQRCASCHLEHVDVKTLQKNFLHDNAILHLKAPSINQISYRLKTKVGDPHGDKEFQKMEAIEFVKEYVKHPDRQNSICSKTVLKHFETMPAIKDISDEDLEKVAAWIYDQKSDVLPKKRGFDFDKILQQAKKENKIIILEATSPTCHYCRWMEKTTLKDKEVQERLRQHFIFIPVDITKQKLPLGIEWNLTPSFIFITPKGKIIKTVPGAWEKEDFLKILDEVRK